MINPEQDLKTAEDYQKIVEQQLTEYYSDGETSTPAPELIKKMAQVLLKTLGILYKEDFDYAVVAWECLHCPECEGTGMKRHVADEENPDCDMCRGTGIR